MQDKFSSVGPSIEASTWDDVKEKVRMDEGGKENERSQMKLAPNMTSVCIQSRAIFDLAPS